MLWGGAVSKFPAMSSPTLDAMNESLANQTQTWDYLIESGRLYNSTGHLIVGAANDSWLLSNASGYIYIKDDIELDGDVTLPDDTVLETAPGATVTVDVGMLTVGNNNTVSIDVLIGANHRGYWIYGENKDNIKLIGVKVNGNSAAIGVISNPADKTVGRFNGCTDFLSTECEFFDMNGAAFVMNACHNTTIVENKFLDLVGLVAHGGFTTQTNAALYIQDSNATTFSRNKCYNIDDNVVGVVGCKNISIQDNIVNDCRHLAIIHDSLLNNVSDVIVSGNIGTGFEKAIILGWYDVANGYYLSCQDVLITNNKLSAIETDLGTLWTKYSAIWFMYDTNNVTFRGNDFAADQWCVIIDGTQTSEGDIRDIIIDGGTLRGANTGGDVATLSIGYMTNSEIKNVRLETGATGATPILYGGKNCRIINCDFVSKSSGAASLPLDNCVMRGNRFYSKGINLNAITGAVVDGNDFLNGASVSNPESNIIRRNTGYVTESSGSSTVPSGAYPTGSTKWIDPGIAVNFNASKFNFKAGAIPNPITGDLVMTNISTSGCNITYTDTLVDPLTVYWEYG